MIKKLLFKKLSYKFTKITATLNLKPKELKINESSRCLCLAPHADDESIGMGGTLALFPKNFDIVLLTNGKKGMKDLPEEEIIKTREQELKCAMDIAKVENIKFFRIDDKKLLEGYEIFKNLDIKEYDHIFLPNIIDQHPDHKAVSILLKRLFDEKETNPNLKICFYEVWSTLGFVNSYIDISDIIDKKRAMINCYKSQIEDKDYEYHALGLNQYRGMFKDKKFVEAFCVMDKEEFKKIAQLY